MIARLSGIVVEKRGDAAVVEVQGVGYLVHLSLQSLGGLPAEGGRAQLRCYTHVREDALQLYGFVTPEEEELFHLLISVSGVGPKLGMELKDRLRTSGLATAGRPSRPPPAGATEELLSALVNLGYRPAAAERTAETVRRNLGPQAPLEDQLREALRLIAGAP
jgi:Holliday junction DNA helicase RuvA